MKLTFVFELMSPGVGSKPGEHYASLILEQPQYQAYICADLHRHYHGQLTDEEKDDYICQLQHKGFERVSREASLQSTRRPKLYYIILDKEYDWNIHEIKVLNRFQDHEELMQLVHQLNLSELAHHLLITKWDETKDWVNGRNNFQLSHGYNHLNQTDRERIPGLCLPQRHMKPQNMDGLGWDKDMEATLIRKQIINTKILDWMTKHFQIDTVFPLNSRKALFVSQDIEKLGHTAGDMRCEGGTFNVSGTLNGRTTQGASTAICTFHIDKYNEWKNDDDCGGSNKNYCYNEMLEMPYPYRGGQHVPIRAALNQYDKRCVGLAYDKTTATDNFIVKATEYVQRTQQQLDEFSYIDWVGKHDMVREAATLERVDYATIEADPNKDCHYSWHIHVIFCEVLPVFGWNEYILVEVLFCLTLTPSSIGFRQGVRYAIAARNNGRNFITNFVQEMVFKHGATAYQFGKKSRHQVSSQGLLSSHDMCVSCFNLLFLIRYANLSSSCSEKLYQDMSSHTHQRKRGHIGGVFGAELLTCNSIVKISVMIGLITNAKHAYHVQIPSGTETSNRLAQWGITTERHRQQLLDRICTEFHIEDQNIGENIVCETGRYFHSDEGQSKLGVDTLAFNQFLYQLTKEDANMLSVTRPDGSKFIQRRDFAKHWFSKKQFFFQYCPTHQWWEMNRDEPYLTLGYPYDLVLTKNSKVLKSYMEKHATTR